jgi:hypothetical protein
MLVAFSMQPVRRSLAFTFPHRAYSSDRLLGYVLAGVFVKQASTQETLSKHHRALYIRSKNVHND